AAVSGATAMMDVSDSLSLDAARLADASGAAIILESALLESGFGVQRGEEVPVSVMLRGGEDHGLLATFPSSVPLPQGFSRIGSVVARVPESSALLLDGEPFLPSGWDPYTVLPPGS